MFRKSLHTAYLGEIQAAKCSQGLDRETLIVECVQTVHIIVLLAKSTPEVFDSSSIRHIFKNLYWRQQLSLEDKNFYLSWSPLLNCQRRLIRSLGL